VHADVTADVVDEPAIVDATRWRRWLWGMSDLHLAKDSLFVRSIVVVQLVAIVGLGLLTVGHFEIWARLDEQAHFDYVQTIADQHRLPTLNTHAPPGHLELGAHTYEAFQPPLYYLVAAPLLKLSHVLHTRVLILRSFGLFLLLAAVFATWRLGVVVFPTRPLLPFAFGLVFFLLPGVIVRSITVSYQPLATLLAIVFLALLFKADRAKTGEAGRWLLGAALALTLAILTTLLVIPLAAVFAVVAARRLWRDRNREVVLVLAGCAVIAVALASPWVVFNERHYGSLTPFSEARRLQQPLINPDEHNFTLGEAPHIAKIYVRESFLPNEWVVFIVDDHQLDHVIWLMFYLLVVFPAVLFVVRPRTLAEDSAALLAFPIVVSLVFLEATTLIANWPTYGRYLYGAGPAWMLAVYVAVRRVLRHRVAPLAVLVLATAGAGYLWAEAGLRYF
jgi:4-amino-4-deoxy-L-arabinose transferase-like glycosyltransferase